MRELVFILWGEVADRRYSLGILPQEPPTLYLEQTHSLSPDDMGIQRSPSTVSQNQSGDVVECSDCGAWFKGQHARGNLTRHRKTRTCASSEKRKEWQCESCDNVYQRSDALLKHMRKVHNYPGPERKNDNSEEYGM